MEQAGKVVVPILAPSQDPQEQVHLTHTGLKPLQVLDKSQHSARQSDLDRLLAKREPNHIVRLPLTEKKVKGAVQPDRPAQIDAAICSSSWSAEKAVAHAGT